MDDKNIFLSKKLKKKLFLFKNTYTFLKNDERIWFISWKQREENTSTDAKHDVTSRIPGKKRDINSKQIYFGRPHAKKSRK